MRPSVFLVTILAITPALVRADVFSVEDDTMTALPKQVAEAIYNTEGKKLADFRQPKNGLCKLIGMRVDLVLGTKSAYFTTTGNACNWGAAIGPIWLVLADPQPVVVISDGGQALSLEKQMQNGLPNIIITAAAASWSQKSWWKYDGTKYVKSKEELCSAPPEEGSSLQCKTSNK